MAFLKQTAAAEFAIPVTIRLLDQMYEQVAGHIRRVNTGFFLIAAPLPLKPERKLEIKFDGRAIECQVVYCQSESANNYLLGVRMAQLGTEALRAEPRIPLELEAKLHLPGEEAGIVGRAVNISASGLGLFFDREVPTNEIAYVELQIGFAFGEIRHCTRSEAGYRVGLKLDEFISRENEILAAKNRSTAAAPSNGFGRFFRRKA
ncbi:MAG: PilZ domain-containing protein [Acidobacteriaceae bacterium]|nr:PilZ domain-containing protein [Acidobacteriaceae bacterium]